MNTKDRVPFYVNACHEMGIEVLPPDVNFSQCDFAVVEGKIRFGLNAVKNVGDSAARAIVAAREQDGPFESIWDFTERVDPTVANKRALESLVKCGALDSTGASRKGMFECLEAALALGQSSRRRPRSRARARSSTSASRTRRRGRSTIRTIPTDEWEKHELLRLEKETLGLYVSEHPLSAVRDQLRRKTEMHARRARAPPRRRHRHRRRHRRGGEAGDDEEGRPDGLPPARGHDGRRRVRRLQLDVRERARALRRRPHPHRQGPRRPQGRRDEADRARRRRVRGDPGAARTCA